MILPTTSASVRGRSRSASGASSRGFVRWVSGQQIVGEKVGHDRYIGAIAEKF